MKKIIFVCLGNICRSPMAEAMAQKSVADRGETAQFDIISRATGTGETGSTPHSGTQKVLKKYGIPRSTHRASQITEADFLWADVIIGMDAQNITRLKKMAPPNAQNKIKQFYPALKFLIRITPAILKKRIVC